MTSAASNFTNFIEWLNKSAIRYFIAWGHEKLPQQPSGGDVDLYVHPNDYLIVAKELTERGYSHAQCPAYNPRHRHAQFAQAGHHSIDLFSSFCFIFEGKTTLLTIGDEHLLLGKIKYAEMWIANPIVEMLFTALRIVGGRKDCLKRLKKYLETIDLGSQRCS